VIFPGVVAAQTFGNNSAVLTNQYLPMGVGDKLTYKMFYGIGIPQFDVHIEAIDREIIDQVKCLKVKLSDNLSLTGTTNHWLAEDTSGNIMILQYHDVESNDFRYFGRANAKLFMPLIVNVGSVLWNSDGIEKVVATGVLVESHFGFGLFPNCIKTRVDYQNGDYDSYYYAPNVGLVQFEYFFDNDIIGYGISSISRRPKSMPWLPLLLE
jgi:hypothetical protein